MKIHFDGRNIFFEGGDQGRSQEDFQEQSSASSTKKKKKQGMSGGKSTLLSLLLTLVFAAVYFYVAIPAINPHALEFWFSLILVLAVFVVLRILTGGMRPTKDESLTEVVKKKCKIPVILMLACVAVVVIGSAVGWVIFRAGSYSKLLPVNTGDFTQEVAEVSWDQIPMLDSNSANTLANRKLGELSDLVSQFEVDESSAQINYQNAPVRVTYLNYGGIIKWWKNRDNGIPAYMVTDMRTQAVTVVRLEEGIKYSPSELFNRYIDRHLRFLYPTAIFGDVNFEIDENGTPYWVASVEKKTIGLFGGTDVQGAVLVNAITGEGTYYDVEDVPTWVDRVYDADLVMTQYDYYGEYHNGFWNSIFGQTDCTVTTEGYNYIAMDDDVWLYTGITSVGGDESNIGFILVNQRTKEAHYYSCAGANEYSGMASAEGAVQQFSYDATFPLLMNINGEPTYFMALKDASQLVKMYAMVNVQEYQIVATGSSVEGCLENYQNLLAQNGVISAEEVTPISEVDTVTGQVEEIRSAVMEGNTTYFIRLAGESCYYTITAVEAPQAVILNEGDTVTITYVPQENTDLLTATDIQ
jgi:hypothetical protein